MKQTFCGVTLGEARDGWDEYDDQAIVLYSFVWDLPSMEKYNWNDLAVFNDGRYQIYRVEEGGLEEDSTICSGYLSDIPEVFDAIRQRVKGE